jgi:DME family drug/metabolite transporter
VKHSLSIIFILIAAMMWGTTGTAQVFAPAEAHPIIIGASRLAVGGLSLFIFLMAQGKFQLRGWPVLPTFIAALSMAAYQPFFFSAVSITGVAVGTVVAIGSAPIIAGLLDWVIQRKPPGPTWGIATILAIAGCLLLTLPGEEVTVSPVGFLLAIGAGLSFAVYTAASKELLQQQPSEAVVAVVFSLSGLFLVPLFFLYDLSWLTEFRGIFVVLHLGIVATAIAYLLFTRGLTGVASSTAVTLALAEPLTAALLGVFLVGEALSFIAWGGVLLLLLGLAVLTGFTGAKTPSTRFLRNKKDKVNVE